MVESGKGEQRERRRRRKRKPEEKQQLRNVKLATARDHKSRGTRTRQRTNGNSGGNAGGSSLSSRGSATSLQCGLCAILASLFRRAMCIAGSRRGSGESCYQELATEMQQQQQQQSQHLQMQIDMPEHKQCDIIVAISAATPEKTSFNRNNTENIYEVGYIIYLY